MKTCRGCFEEFDEEELTEYPEDSDFYYCKECCEDMSNTCPRCGGHGCEFCLMLDW